MGGLHLATAYSLATDVPLVYLSPAAVIRRALCSKVGSLPGQHALLVDDLITTGGSVIATANAMRKQGLVVRDIIVLIDRDQGAARRLQQHGLHLLPILSLRTMLNYYMSEQLIREEDYRRSLAYIARKPGRCNRRPCRHEDRDRQDPPSRWTAGNRKSCSAPATQTPRESQCRRRSITSGCEAGLRRRRRCGGFRPCEFRRGAELILVVLAAIAGVLVLTRIFSSVEAPLRRTWAAW